MIRRIVAGFALVVLGLAAGVADGFVQAMRWSAHTPWGTVVVPWGAVLAVVVLLSLIRGAVWALRTLVGGWLVLGGWLVATLWAASASPSGDLAISAGGRQWAYVLGGVILGAASATFPVIDRSSLTIAEEPPSTDDGEPSPQ